MQVTPVGEGGGGVIDMDSGLLIRYDGIKTG